MGEQARKACMGNCHYQLHGRRVLSHGLAAPTDGTELCLKRNLASHLRGVLKSPRTSFEESLRR